MLKEWVQEVIFVKNYLFCREKNHTIWQKEFDLNFSFPERLLTFSTSAWRAPVFSILKINTKSKRVIFLNFI
jgi:hypothetical protein